MRLQVVKQIRFSTGSKKLVYSKRYLKNQAVSVWLNTWVKISPWDIEKCMTFTETVLYWGNINEAYVERRINIYDNQKTISSMKLPPNPDCATQVIVRVHFQCYYYVQCLQEIK